MSRLARKSKSKSGRSVPTKQQSEDDALPIPQEVLENLPEETRIAIFQSASFKGPLPPPSLFGKYEEILPGSANRILQLTEREQSQRHAWDNKALEFRNKEVSRGQLYGLGLGVAAIVGAVVCAYFGQTLVAIIIGGTSLAGIVAAFIRLLARNEW